MSGITFKYSGSEAKLSAAVAHATELLSSPAFRKIIESRKTGFFNTARTPKDIAKTIFETSTSIEIRMFSKKPRGGMITTAYVSPGTKDVIFFNTYAVGRGVRSNTNTLVHEAVHVVDRFHDRIASFDFTHKGNNPRKPPQNRDSAPYWIGNRAQDFVIAMREKDESDFKSLSKAPIGDLLGLVTDINWAEDEHFYCGTGTGT